MAYGDDGESDENDENDEKDRNDGSRPPFKFNCIHDLESVWWIALWVLFLHFLRGMIKTAVPRFSKLPTCFLPLVAPRYE
jgi:hypothetical protein